MSVGYAPRVFVLCLLASIPAIGLAGCSGGGSGDSPGLNSISSAVQDLAADPDGATSVLSFASATGLSTATAANFEADGGQTAQSVVVVGSQATVAWDLRVTPSHQVRAVGLAGVDPAFHAVATSDGSAPAFTVASATQNPGLGGDTIQLAFSGPRLIQAEAEDPARWGLETDGQALDLTGSTFVLDPLAQTVDVTLGVNANLHATFSIAALDLHSVADVAVSTSPVAGGATGDTTPPSLVSANQNLAQDEYGRVIDFTFDEAMDPVFSTGLAHFIANLPDIATNVEQPTEDVLRVAFNNPIVPGHDTITLQGLVDLHGNAFPDTVQAISQPSPVANAFASPVQAVSVENAGGDFVSATTTQALDPDSATLPASWSLSVAGSPVDLAQQVLTYDFIGKTLRIDLAFDLVNGQPFTLQAVNTREVDGESFTLSDTGAVSGDATPPSAGAAVQNRVVDLPGTTVDVTMSEDVDLASAETLANWAASGGQNVVSATVVSGLDTVRLEFDAPMIPGDVTISVQNVQDLAGNVMSLQAGLAVTSTDTTAPSVTGFSGSANEGAANDVIEVLLDDDPVLTEIADTTRWALESPVGTLRSTAGATVLWEPTVRRARLKLVNGENLRRGDDFSFTLTGVRDLGGNLLPATPHAGLVLAESTLPAVSTVWRPGASPDALEVRFSEPCDLLEDLYDAVLNPTGTRYVLRDSGGTLRGLATGATSLDDGLAARVSFGIVVAATDTIDVIGASDLAGNPLFPALLVPTVAEDPVAPGLAAGLSAFVSVSGENNDTFVVRFDRPMSPWTIADHVHYTPTGPTTVAKRTRDLVFDGVDTVTVPILGNAADFDLLTGSGYDLEVDGVLDIQGVRSAQGVLLPGPVSESAIVVTGDATPPDVDPAHVRLDPADADALLVEFTEAVAPPSATNPASYAYDAATPPVAAVLVNPRVARLTFAAPPLAGHSLTLDVADRAGNPSGSIARTVSAADAAGPLVVAVDGLLVPGFGRDEVHVDFDEPLAVATAVNPASYTVQSGGVARSLAGAVISYASASHRVTIRLAGGQDLLAGGALSVGISLVEDVSGNAMAAPVQIAGPTSGDSVAPALAGAFVNWRFDPSGRFVDVRFSEDVDTGFALDTANWSASGGAGIVAVVLSERDHYRVELSSALLPAGSMQITGLPDVAGNLAGTIAFGPVQ